MSRKQATHRIDTGPFLAKEGARVRLADWPTHVAPVYRGEEGYRAMLSRHVERLSDLQELLYASDVYSLLLVFQGMDTSGKDGAIKHVMSGVNPQGCRVTSFKHPSGTELEHDFLWRTTRELPERGCIGIFNRSYYEEVVVVRVHPALLRAEGLPDPDARTAKIWRARYKSINGFEEHLTRSGTRVVKFFLHISLEEQRKRLLARIDEPRKQWKFRAADLEERKFWSEYLEAYSDAIEATSTRKAPWYIVPADDKYTARLVVSQAVTDTLEGLDMRYPKPGEEEAQQLRALRETLDA